MGIGMRAVVRSQINLVMNAAEHVKQFKGVRDIVYPILWFQVSISHPQVLSFSPPQKKKNAQEIGIIPIYIFGEKAKKDKKGGILLILQVHIGHFNGLSPLLLCPANDSSSIYLL